MPMTMTTTPIHGGMKLLGGPDALWRSVRAIANSSNSAVPYTCVHTETCSRLNERQASAADKPRAVREQSENTFKTSLCWVSYGTSAHNMTLPAAELCRQQISIDSRYAAPEAIGRYLPPAPELQQTSCTSLPLSIDGTDRRTDTVRVTYSLTVRSVQRQQRLKRQLPTLLVRGRTRRQCYRPQNDRLWRIATLTPTKLQ